MQMAFSAGQFNQPCSDSGKHIAQTHIHSPGLCLTNWDVIAHKQRSTNVLHKLWYVVFRLAQHQVKRDVESIQLAWNVLQTFHQEGPLAGSSTKELSYLLQH